MSLGLGQCVWALQAMKVVACKVEGRVSGNRDWDRAWPWKSTSSGLWIGVTVPRVQLRKSIEIELLHNADVYMTQSRQKSAEMQDTHTKNAWGMEYSGRTNAIPCRRTCVAGGYGRGIKMRNMWWKDWNRRGEGVNPVCSDMIYSKVSALKWTTSPFTGLQCFLCGSCWDYEYRDNTEFDTMLRKSTESSAAERKSMYVGLPLPAKQQARWIYPIASSRDAATRRCGGETCLREIQHLSKLHCHWTGTFGRLLLGLACVTQNIVCVTNRWEGYIALWLVDFRACPCEGDRTRSACDSECRW